MSLTRRRPQRLTPEPARPPASSCRCAPARIDSEWVQCDLCARWRIVKRSAIDALPDDVAWVCGMNSDVRHNSCSAPQRLWMTSAPEDGERVEPRGLTSRATLQSHRLKIGEAEAAQRRPPAALSQPRSHSSGSSDSSALHPTVHSTRLHPPTRTPLDQAPPAPPPRAQAPIAELYLGYILAISRLYLGYISAIPPRAQASGLQRRLPASMQDAGWLLLPSGGTWASHRLEYAYIGPCSGAHIGGGGLVCACTGCACRALTLAVTRVGGPDASCEAASLHFARRHAAGACS